MVSARIRSFVAVGLGFAAGSVSSIAIAQTAEADLDSIQEVMVTAQRRSQNVQDVGIAISVMSADDIRAKALTSSVEIADFMPGVHMSGSLAGQSQQFSIRGVTQNDFNDSIEAPVAVYADDAYIPTQQGQTLALFDVARVEVLKGPQGTLFGRNATGGLVHFVVEQPTRELGGYIDASYGRFDETKVEAAISGPLSPTIAARLSVLYSSMDDVWQNVRPAGAVAGLPLEFGPPLSSCCDDEGSYKSYAGRLQFEYAPSDDLSIRLVGSYAKRKLSTAPYTTAATTAVVDSQGRIIDSIRTAPDDTRTVIGPDGENYFNPAIFPLQGAQTGLGFGPAPGLRFPGATWFGYNPVDPDDLKLSVGFARHDANHDRSDSTALHVRYDFGPAELVSVSSFMNFDKMYMMDATGSPQNINQYGTDSNTSSFSQEFRLSGSSDAFRWVTGLYYLDIDAHGKDGLIGSTGSLFAGVFGLSATGVDPISDRTLKTKSTSLFGQVEYDFAPKWTFIAGARAINEKQDYALQYYAAQNDNDYEVDSATILFPLPYAPFSDKRTQHLYAGKLQLEFRPVDGLLLFLGGNRGVKAGSYNAKIFDGSPDIDPANIPYDPEVLTSIEGGAKWSAGHYSLGASVYHYDYKDYQAFQFTNNTGFVQNVKAKSTGFELEGQVRLMDGLNLNGGYAYLDAEIPDYEIAPGVFKNVRPTFSSENSAHVGLTYTLPADLAGGSIALNGDVSYSSSFYHNLRNFASEKLDGRTLSNASVTWMASESGWRVSGFVRNITDKRYATIGFDSSPNCGCSIEAYGMPRTYGISVGNRF